MLDEVVLACATFEDCMCSASDDSVESVASECCGDEWIACFGKGCVFYVEQFVPQRCVVVVFCVAEEYLYVQEMDRKMFLLEIKLEGILRINAD
jgi:hypothetical protein